MTRQADIAVRSVDPVIIAWGQGFCGVLLVLFTFGDSAIK